jgi:hypothetical protein
MMFFNCFFLFSMIDDSFSYFLSFFWPALETLSSAVNTLIASRVTTNAAVTWTALSAINQAFQCLGSLLVAPLIRRFYINHVLSVSIWVFGALVALIPIAEVITGGHLDTSIDNPKDAEVRSTLVSFVSGFQGNRNS